MDCTKVGNLIAEVRKEKGMTQKQIADALHISDKTVSKWERGLGCPDVSLLGDLSGILQVDIERILEGDLSPNVSDGGNMKRVKFYVCKSCGNVLTATGEADISCCGRKLESLRAMEGDRCHRPVVEHVEDEFSLTFPHEMTKKHYISFAAYVTYDRITLVKLYPEQDAQIRMAGMRRGKIYVYCSEHGLMIYEA